MPSTATGRQATTVVICHGADVTPGGLQQVIGDLTERTQDQRGQRGPLGEPAGRRRDPAGQPDPQRERGVGLDTDRQRDRGVDREVVRDTGQRVDDAEPGQLTESDPAGPDRDERGQRQQQHRPRPHRRLGLGLRSGRRVGSRPGRCPRAAGTAGPTCADSTNGEPGLQARVTCGDASPATARGISSPCVGLGSSAPAPVGPGGRGLPRSAPAGPYGPCPCRSGIPSSAGSVTGCRRSCRRACERPGSASTGPVRGAKRDAHAWISLPATAAGSQQIGRTVAGDGDARRTSRSAEACGRAGMQVVSDRYRVASYEAAGTHRAPPVSSRVRPVMLAPAIVASMATCNSRCLIQLNRLRMTA